jgi:methylase of polypeptide subunit release factors
MSIAVDTVWTVDPFHFGTADEFARLREFLVRARYTGEAICDRLEIGTIHDFLMVGEGRTLVPELTDPQALLLRLFLDAEPVAWSIVRSILSPAELHALEALGLLHTLRDDPDQCAATVLLYPTEELYIISDRNQDPDKSPIRPPTDVVYPAVTRNTQRFMAMLPRTRCGDFLELCSGTGIAALVAARNAGQAWAVDITERATRFAQFNAALNGIANMTALQGDLYEPVRGQTFDRIVAHPPYMPALRQEYVYRDGGEDGEQITRRIVEGLPTHLRPGGRFYCNCLLTDRKDAPVEQRLRRMLGEGEGEGEFDVVVGQMQTFEPVEYYAKLAAKGMGKFSEVELRHRLFKQLEIEQMVFCTFVVRRRSSARSVFTVRRQLGVDTAARHFEWLLRWEAEALDPGLRARLLEARPVFSRQAELRLVHCIVEGEWAIAKCWVATHLPFALEAASPVWVAALSARCDGTRTVRELLQHLQEVGVMSAEVTEDDFVELIQKFIGGGFLETEEFPLPRPA